MTVFGGDVIYAADLNNLLQRLATTPGTSNLTATSGTTEKAGDQVTANVVSGTLYKIRWYVKYGAGTAADVFNLRIREGSGIAGNQIELVGVYIPSSATYTAIVEAEWTASSTTSQTFTGTVQRSSGTGTLVIAGSSTAPRRLTIDKVV